MAALIRYGVNTSQALALLTHGIQSRRLAYRLGSSPMSGRRAAGVAGGVELRVVDHPSGELVMLYGEERLGVIGTRDHTDVKDVLASVLEVTTVVVGETLTFTVPDGT